MANGNQPINPFATYIPGVSEQNTLLPANMQAGVPPVIDPRPQRPEFMSPLDEQGMLGQQYQLPETAINFDPTVMAGQLDMQALTPDQRAVEEIRKRAFETGPSAWMQLQLERQGIEETGMRERAARDIAGATAAAESQLAMRGGLGSGARERIAAGGASELARAQQQASRAGQLARLDIGESDIERRDKWLAALPGIDLAQAQHMADLEKFQVQQDLQADMFSKGAGLDIAMQNAALQREADKWTAGQSLDWLGQENLYNQDVYGQQMQEWAANQQAEAIQQSAPKGGGGPGELLKWAVNPMAAATGSLFG